MNNDNGKIGFSVELNTAQLNRDIQRSKQYFKDLGDHVSSESSKIDNALGGIGRTVVSIGTAWSLQELGKNVVTIRGEFQSLQKTMEVMLQSKSKAEALMAQMVQTAATTPFGLQEVAGGAKQLLAYGLEVEKVNDTLIRLGNIASALKIPLGDLIYLYGTTMAQGRLYTQDLNQFTGRGIPMIKGLADYLGVAENKVKGLVEAGKVGFPEVQAVINNLTNEGGKFFNLMEEQSTLINGKISNLEDAFDSMFNEIGQNNEGIINDTIDLSMLLVENYETVGNVLMTLVADYGVYKATLMAVTAYTNACYNYEIAQLKAVVAEKGAEIDADLASAVSKGRMTAQRATEVQALRQEIAAKIETATVTERIAQAELAQATMKYESYQVTVSLSKMRVAQAQQELAVAQATGDAVAIENAQSNLNTAIKERNNVTRQSSILKRNMETAATNANTASQTKATLVTKADTAAKKVQATTTSLLTLCTNGLTKAFKALKIALATNPFGIIMVAITTVIGALMTMNDTMEETSEDVERFGESAVKTTRNVETLLAVINNTSRNSKVHKDAVNELIKIYKDYGIKIDDECSKLEQLNALRNSVIKLIREEGEERQKANLIASYEEAANKVTQNMQNKLLTALKNAELDGSGFFDDWDAGSVQKRAEQLSIIIGGIYSSEAEALSKLTGEEYDNKIKEIKERAISAFQDINGFANDENGRAYATFLMGVLDVDFDDIFNDYLTDIKDIYIARQQLIDRTNDSKSALTEESEEVDYAKLSFDELFKAAHKANEEIKTIGTAEVTPNVNTSSIDGAISRTETLLSNVGLLGSISNIPTWDNNSSVINIPTFSPLPSLPSLPSTTTTTGNNSQQQALNELDKRVLNAIKTRKGTSDLLKEVNTALETAEAGSVEEKQLLQIQQRLKKQQQKFDTDASERIANIQKAEQDVTDIITENSRTRQDLQANLKFQEEQQLINLETDAIKRRQKQRELDNKKELYQLEQQKQAAIRAEIQRQKAVFDAEENEKKAKNPNYVKKNFTQADIDESEITTIVEKYKTLNGLLVNLQRQRATQERQENTRAMNEYLKEYGTYLEKRQAIVDLYNEQIANATSEGEKLSLTAKMREELSNLDIEANKTTAAISKLFGDMTNKTVADMRKIANNGQKALNFLLNEVWADEKGLEFGMTKETFDMLSKSPEELEKIRKAIRGIINEADKSDSAFNKVTKGLKDLFKSGNDANKTKDAIDTIQEGLNDFMQVGSFLSDSFSSLGEAFGSKGLTDIAEGAQVAMDTVNGAMQGAQAGAAFGPWGAAAGAAIGLVSSLASSLAKLHDAKHEIKIQELQEKIDALEKSYEKLSTKIEDAYSKDASRMIEQQNTMLEQQKLLIQEQIEEERQKKAVDTARIEEWEAQIEEINELLAENKEKAIDAIFGEDLKSAIENFADAYAEAWASNESKAIAAKDVVKKMMQQMVTESIKAALQSSRRMEYIRQKLQEFYADNILSQYEQDYIYNMAEALQDELDNRFGWADSLMDDNDSSSQNSTKQGFSAMSQDSADELNGRFTAIQMETSSIKQLMLSYGLDMKNLNILTATIKQNIDEMKNLSLTAIDHLERISANTHELYEMNERLGKIEKNTRRL